MAQVFSAAAVLWMKLAGIALPVFAAAAAIAYYQHLQGPYSRGEAAAQPIPFSHKHHVGDDGIDCRYCHANVETATFAEIPSSDVCMTCHSQLFTDAPVLEPLRASVATGKPIAWVRLHDLPGFAYFDHGIHVRNGVQCAQCHGRVDLMPLTRRVASLEMQWCLDCHRKQAPALRRRLTDCSTCHR
jgi:Cytochrome c7 and related cytochrome c